MKLANLSNFAKDNQHHSPVVLSEEELETFASVGANLAAASPIAHTILCKKHFPDADNQDNLLTFEELTALKIEILRNTDKLLENVGFLFDYLLNVQSQTHNLNFISNNIIVNILQTDIQSLDESHSILRVFLCELNLDILINKHYFEQLIERIFSMLNRKVYKKILITTKIAEIDRLDNINKCNFNIFIMLQNIALSQDETKMIDITLCKLLCNLSGGKLKYECKDDCTSIILAFTAVVK